MCRLSPLSAVDAPSGGGLEMVFVRGVGGGARGVQGGDRKRGGGGAPGVGGVTSLTALQHTAGGESAADLKNCSCGRVESGAQNVLSSSLCGRRLRGAAVKPG